MLSYIGGAILVFVCTFIINTNVLVRRKKLGSFMPNYNVGHPLLDLIWFMILFCGVGFFVPSVPVTALLVCCALTAAVDHWGLIFGPQQQKK